ncbi:MAG: EAL domain-containing protein [Aridibacter sp.]
MNEADDKKPRILIIDDEPAIGELLCDVLTEYDCKTASSAEEGISVLEKENFDLVLTDINMKGMSGLEMIPHIHRLAPDAVVMMISGEQNIDTAINALRDGVFDYLRKPFNLEYVKRAVERAVEHYELVAAKRLYETHLEELVEQRTAQLNYLTYHDALTRLPNRVLFEDRLSQALRLARHSEQLLAILFLSLDRFKKVHDTLGSASEEYLLQAVAERLKNCIRGSGATIARFERNEFALLLTQIDDTQTVIEIINDINETLKPAFIIDEHEIFITASIGVSFYPNDGEETETLLKNAGAALYRAKKQGRNNYQFYTADMNAEAMQRMSLENNLRRALKHSEFEVFYQPKINLGSGHIVGTEALVRWRHPELGLVSPSEFIPLAEETGLIVPLGEWVLRAACEQSKLWQDEGFTPLQVSVNLSPRQFKQKNLLEVITEIIKDTAVDATCLELELTESSLIENAESAAKTLSELKKTGIKISIDDFGTGCSSLQYLKRLPLDTLKIDRSFIRDAVTDQADAAIIIAIITLAQNLRLKVVAEGVELEEQLKFLRHLKCDEWQGYLYSKPVASADFKKLLQRAAAPN